MRGIFIFSQKCSSLEDKLYGVGDGEISPSTCLEFSSFFPSILSPCCWTNNEIDTRQIKGRKRNKF